MTKETVTTSQQPKKYLGSTVVENSDTGFYIDIVEADRLPDVGEEVFDNFTAAKRYVLKDIDDRIAWLRRERRRISEIKKGDVK